MVFWGICLFNTSWSQCLAGRSYSQLAWNWNWEPMMPAFQAWTAAHWLWDPLTFRPNPITTGDLEVIAFSWNKEAICLGLGFYCKVIWPVPLRTVTNALEHRFQENEKQKALKMPSTQGETSNRQVKKGIKDQCCMWSYRHQIWSLYQINMLCFLHWDNCEVG